METAQRYFTKVKGAAEEKEVLSDIKDALRKRRFRYLPDGVFAEDIHNQKDAWTFAVFLTGLLLPVKNIAIDAILKQILVSESYKWLESKNVLSSLLLIHSVDTSDRNTKLIRSFYTDDSVDPVVKTEPENYHSDPDPKLEMQNRDEKKEPVLSNKEMGELCLVWLLAHAKAVGQVAYLKDGKLYIKSPAAFILYSKEAKVSWKNVQKGVIKSGKHEPNPEDGTPFIKVNGCNMIIINDY